MYDLGSSQLPTSFDPATDSDQHSLREFIDLVADAGYVVDSDEHGDDPELIAPDGSAVETWHEDYPYPNLMDRREYETQKRLLQIELLKLQYSIDDTGERHVIIFEGRDAAGKGGAIKRFSEHLNPRRCRVVALDKPSDRELGQWNFQRYIQHLPTAGEIVLFDRSWYNRGGVERVMGFCTDEEHRNLPSAGSNPRRDDDRIGHSCYEVLVLGHPAGATHPVRNSSARSSSSLEALPDGLGVAGALGRLHPC